jgi:hypothetical protein
MEVRRRNQSPPQGKAGASRLRADRRGGQSQLNRDFRLLTVCTLCVRFKNLDLKKNKREQTGTNER